MVTIQPAEVTFRTLVVENYDSMIQESGGKKAEWYPIATFQQGVTSAFHVEWAVEPCRQSGVIDLPQWVLTTGNA